MQLGENLKLKNIVKVARLNPMRCKVSFQLDIRAFSSNVNELDLKKLKSARAALRWGGQSMSDVCQ